MISRGTYSLRAIGLLSILLIAAAMILVPVAESLADAGEEHHCGDECENCGDCVQCLPTIHMAPGDAVLHGTCDAPALWSLQVPPMPTVTPVPTSIDHPPQNSH
jgi:hypothetical protein